MSPRRNKRWNAFFKQLAPILIGFSEVSNVSANFVTGLLNEWIPIEEGAVLGRLVKDDWDLMVAAKGKHLGVVRFGDPTISSGRGRAVLIGGCRCCSPPSHMKCCGGSSNEAQRQAVGR